MNYFNEVIAAVSTPPGKGGVAVIRMSGDGAFDIAKKAFSPMSKRPLSDYPSRQAIYGYIVDGDERLDDVLLTKFKSPHSYTGEDTIEISCHGGIFITRSVLEVLLRHGARAAEAGEFTRRAFVNGRLTLTEAEAIGTLLEAKSREMIRLSSDTSRTRLRCEIDGIRSSLVSVMSSVFARIDYPDEDLGDYSDGELLCSLQAVLKRAERLLSTYRTGRAVSEGVRAVICGKPNVGKSSLYNLIAGEDLAIVTDVEGTTRDVLEREIPLGGVLLRLADTAGIRCDGYDTVEQIGIEKSRQMIEKSELLFALFDCSRAFSEADELLIDDIKNTKAPKIAILNKSDLEEKFDTSRIEGIFDRVIKISVEETPADAIAALSGAVRELFLDEKITVGEDAIISSARQHASLLRAVDFLKNAVSSLESGFLQDAVSFDVECALGAISELDGREVNEEIVADIFSKFCVGK